MDLYACVEAGEFVEKPGKMHWEWRIPNFLKADKKYCSSRFLFHDCCWCLAIDYSDETEKCISLYLKRLDCGPPRTVVWTFGIRKADGMEEIIGKEESCTFFLPADSCWEDSNFLQMSDLLNRKSELAPSNTLTITFSLKSDESEIVGVSLFERLWNLSVDFLKILNKREGCDVLLKLKDGEIPAHGTILGTRCEVFQRMLNTDMRESQTGELEVQDGDEETFRVVLSYVYRGDADGLSPTNVCEVFKVAHKYDMQQLMKLCTEFMQGSLSVDIVCDVIVLAEVFQETKLKKCAKDYFVKNASEVVKSDKWKTLKGENPAIVTELLECVVVENISKINIQTSV